MKPILLFAFLALSLNSWAQPDELPWETDHECFSIITDGIAAVTCGVTMDVPYEQRFTFGLIDVRDAIPNSGRVDVTDQQNVYHHPSWHFDSIGNVFGITMDICGHTYVTASANYSSYFFSVPSIIGYGSIGGGEDSLDAAGTIYRIDAQTGQASVFSVLPQQRFQFTNETCEGFGNVARNTGPGLGNICYADRVNQFYVTNFEDGRIYRLGKNGTILDSYDPFGYDDGEKGMTDYLKSPYGIAISNDQSKLFISTQGRTDVGAFNDADTIVDFYGNDYSITFGRVYSLDLNLDGSFVGDIDNSILPLDATWDNYVGSEQMHWSAESVVFGDNFNNFFLNYSLCDLEFTASDHLLVGVRIGCGMDLFNSYNHNGTTFYLGKNGDLYSEEVGEIFTTYQNGRNDAYGGVSAYVDTSGVPTVLISSSDMLMESGPHGISVHQEGVFGDGFLGASPAGIISYNSTFEDEYYDPKGIGGDVYMYRDCNQRQCDILESSDDLSGNITGISVIPNPFSDRTDIHFQAVKSELLDVKLYSSLGNLLHSQKFQSQVGENVLRIDVSNIDETRGVIFCQFFSGDNLVSIKIIRQ